MQVRVSDMKDWRYEALVIIHELVEMFLTKHRGIPEHEISEFDIKFEQSRADQLVCGEPGDHPHAPYRNEHFFATNLERLFSSELGIDWFGYDRDVDALGIKK
jgi:Mn-dependent DtxR family transcriptional regulator